ncbi:hypothetical protein FNV43_RR19548 [Rhamnella rubrinervis]|uniref:Uncharacterized protein n=1 Tax=Rhamnella rubrinervis TaxID=2594499 RepID=A0A8K0GWC6_9ROSA|nr:hypothetical protein FNV43_RR19548 [Rhamnella rubrinervis]
MLHHHCLSLDHGLIADFPSRRSLPRHIMCPACHCKHSNPAKKSTTLPPSFVGFHKFFTKGLVTRMDIKLHTCLISDPTLCILSLTRDCGLDDDPPLLCLGMPRIPPLAIQAKYTEAYGFARLEPQSRKVRWNALLLR